MQTKKKSIWKRFGKKGWSSVFAALRRDKLRGGKRTFPQKVFSPYSSTDLYRTHCFWRINLSSKMTGFLKWRKNWRSFLLFWRQTDRESVCAFAFLNPLCFAHKRIYFIWRAGSDLCKNAITVARQSRNLTGLHCGCFKYNTIYSIFSKIQAHILKKTIFFGSVLNIDW